MINLIQGDCLAAMQDMESDSVDSVVTDPPYGLELMGNRWDCQVPGVEIWKECLRVLKPGGHLLAFAGTRTQHRMACNIEDAGFEVRDMLAWAYGSGFPKSMDVAHAIDRTDRLGPARERALSFTGYMRSTGLTSREINTATGSFMASHYLTAASQPEVATETMFAPLRRIIRERGMEVPAYVEALVDSRTIESENEKKRHLVGTESARNTRDTRLGMPGEDATPRIMYDRTCAFSEEGKRWEGWGTALKPALEPITLARKPFPGTVADNVITWGTGAINVGGCRVGNEIMQKKESDGVVTTENRSMSGGNTGRIVVWEVEGRFPANLLHDGGDEVLANLGKAARFFYCPKATGKDRNEGVDRIGDGLHRNNHPTVKPTDLMRYLCRLVTRPGGMVLDPFMGSGSTGKAAVLEGLSFTGCELDAGFLDIARQRINAATIETYDFLG